MSRTALAALAGFVTFMALTLCGNASFAQDAPAEPSKPAASGDAVPSLPCGDPGSHPHDDPKVCPVKKVGFPSDKTGSSGSSDLAAKLANPSAPIMALNVFLDVIQNGGSAPGAHRASFGVTLQPAIPFPTKRGNVILRPLVPIEFGGTYGTGAGTVETYTGFGNISLETLYGKTLKSGFLIMGGFGVGFPSATIREARADWNLGPAMVIGYASKKTGNIWGVLPQFQWSLPTRPTNGVFALQYFYAINLGKGWQINAQPNISYALETGALDVPLGVGLVKVAALGKKNFPVKLGAQIWGHIPPPGESGPEWTIRFTVAPVVALPWKK
ncbi:MAG: hypothetical protein WBB42_11810 [Polyangiales bacterium]